MKQPTLEQRTSGVTESGLRVVIFFDLVETHGVPLEDCISYIYKHNLIPDFAGFIKEAKEHGWHHERLINRLDAAVCDSMGSEFRDVWRKRLDSWMLLQQ